MPATPRNKLASHFSRGGSSYTCTRRLKPVANPRLRDNVFWTRRIRLYFFPQLINDHAQALGFLAIIGSPHGLQETAMGQRLALIGNQMFEHVVLFGSEVDVTIAHGHLAGLEVNRQIFGDERRESVSRSKAAQGRADSRKELLDAKRLNDVIISASVKRRNFV